MRISDWSSDVCSSDLSRLLAIGRRDFQQFHVEDQQRVGRDDAVARAFGSIAKFRRNPEAVLRAGRHKLDAFGPARDQAAQRKGGGLAALRSEEHTSELQSLMRISYAVFCLKKTTTNNIHRILQKHKSEHITPY